MKYLASKTVKPATSALQRNDQSPQSHSSNSFLKRLREIKKISRVQLSKLTSLSPYQVEGLEGKSTESLFAKMFLCVRALGYNANDVLRLMHLHSPHEKITKGTFAKPISETIYEPGVKLATYAEEDNFLLGRLNLAVGQTLARGALPASDLIFGIVQDGSMVIDMMIQQTVHKKDSFFTLPGTLPFEIASSDNCIPLSALLFCVKYPRQNPSA